MTLTRLIAAAAVFAVIHSLPAWAAVLLLALALAAFAWLAWWVVWRVLAGGRGVVLAWPRACPACSARPGQTAAPSPWWLGRRG